MKLGRSEDFWPVSVSDKERTLGAFVCGATGKGKSTLLENMIFQDVRLKDKAVVVIDPSGFLAQKVYSMNKNAIYLSAENPLPFNPLMAGYSVEQSADMFVEIINHVFEATRSNDPLTGRMKRILISACQWCLEHGRPRLDAVRDRLSNSPDVNYQRHYHAVDGLLDRIDLLLSDPIIARILCQEERFDWREFIDSKQVFIYDSYGFSQEKNIFIGSTITHSLKAYFRMTRQRSYSPLALYVDECQHYINSTFYDVIKEGRKYNIMTTLATQDFANIPQQFTHTILSNIGTIIALSPGYREARELCLEFKDMDAKAVKFTGKHMAAVRTPKFEGLVKMTSPPMVREIEPPTMQQPIHQIWFEMEAA